MLFIIQFLNLFFIYNFRLQKFEIKKLINNISINLWS